jgi:lysophospholipase L1-like esterase
MPHLHAELHDVFERIRRREPVRIAFLGGSITWGACATDPLRTSWRAIVQTQLQDTFTHSAMRFIDASIGGQGSRLAAFRLQRDMLAHSPDLVLVEFAVNDFDCHDADQTLEGIVHQLRATLPGIAIVIVIIGSRWDYHTPAEQSHLAVARHYGLPVINVRQAVSARLSNGLDIRSILEDGCHPNDAGYRLYASIVWPELMRLADLEGERATLPTRPLTANRYAHAKMLELSTLLPQPGWSLDRPALVGTWFDQQPSRWHSSCIMTRQADATLEIPINASIVGLYFETAHDGGCVELSTPHGPLLTIDTARDLPFAKVDQSTIELATNRPTTLRIACKHPRSGVRLAYVLTCPLGVRRGSGISDQTLRRH